MRGPIIIKESNVSTQAETCAIVQFAKQMGEGAKLLLNDITQWYLSNEGEKDNIDKKINANYFGEKVIIDHTDLTELLWNSRLAHSEKIVTKILNFITLFN